MELFCPRYRHQRHGYQPFRQQIFQRQRSANVQHFRSDRNKTETFTASNINASESLTLNNSGSLNLSAANINAGALTASATGNINSNAVKTTNRTESDHTQSKGLWYNNNPEFFY